jgi:hypothetical protein
MFARVNAVFGSDCRNFAIFRKSFGSLWLRIIQSARLAQLTELDT